jgi:hypothetical protein
MQSSAPNKPAERSRTARAACAGRRTLIATGRSARRCHDAGAGLFIRKMLDYTGTVIEGVYAMADDEIERLRDFISRSVSEYWNATGKAMLLSALGLRVRNAFQNTYSLMPDGLQSFLSSWPTVRVVGHPQIPEKIGAIPLDAKMPDNLTELFTERTDWTPGQAPAISALQPHFQTLHPRYATEFWRTFHTQLTGRRFVVPPDDKNPTLRIVERTDGAEEPGGYEVLPSDVSLLPAQAPLYEKVQATSQKINGWLTRYGLSQQLFISRVPEISRRAATQQSFDRRQLVALALSKLDPSDQARILIPLDIVAKMIDTQ